EPVALELVEVEIGVAGFGLVQLRGRRIGDGGLGGGRPGRGFRPVLGRVLGPQLHEPGQDLVLLVAVAVDQRHAPALGEQAEHVPELTRPRFSREPRPLMPIDSPSRLKCGPPLLPGLIEVSTWMQSVYSSSVPAGYW